MWTFNRAELVDTHPDWYSKNRQWRFVRRQAPLRKALPLALPLAAGSTAIFGTTGKRYFR